MGAAAAPDCYGMALSGGLQLNEKPRWRLPNSTDFYTFLHFFDWTTTDGYRRTMPRRDRLSRSRSAASAERLAFSSCFDAPLVVVQLQFRGVVAADDGGR